MYEGQKNFPKESYSDVMIRTFSLSGSAMHLLKSWLLSLTRAFSLRIWLGVGTELCTYFNWRTIHLSFYTSDIPYKRARCFSLFQTTPNSQILASSRLLQMRWVVQQDAAHSRPWWTRLTRAGGVRAGSLTNTACKGQRGSCGELCVGRKWVRQCGDEPSTARRQRRAGGVMETVTSMKRMQGQLLTGGKGKQRKERLRRQAELK